MIVALGLVLGLLMHRRIPVILFLVALSALVIASCAPRTTTQSGGSGGGGIPWIRNDLAGGMKRARAERKKIFLYFGAGY